MSETTRKLRNFMEMLDGADIAVVGNVRGLKNLAADAIEAVEAQVAEAVARVAALEKRGIDAQGGNRSGESPAGKLAPTGSSESGLGTDRGASSAPASPPAPSAVPAPELWHRATQGFVSSTLPTDMWPHEPPSSAFAAPRGFRVGDRVRPVWSPNEPGWRINDIDDEGLVYVKGWTRARRSAAWRPSSLTLVRAAATPEAPAEVPTTRPTPAMEIDALRGEVARLTKERDETRAISAATAERVRNETQIATELRKDLDDLRAKLATAEQAIDVERNAHASTRTALVGSRGQVEMVTQDRRAIIDGAEKERDALRAELDKHQETERMRLCAISVAAGCNTPESAAKQRIAAGNPYWTLAYGDVCAAVDREMSLRAKLAALRAKPRFRTRKVTKADVEDFIAHDGCFYESLRALGFRRRVDGAK